MAKDSVANAVLYLRMSSSKQEQSIPAQRSELIAYAKKRMYTVIREYVDEAISGDDTARRTDFLRMREDAQTADFEVVLCWDQDRFGRFDPIEGGYWITPFRQAGVRLETIAQGKINWDDFAGRLLYLIQQEGKHAYLRDLSRNTVRGHLATAKAGRVAGGSPPYSYRIQNGVLVIVEKEAAIVRLIFSEYLKPMASLRSVASMLNAEGIPSPRNGKWSSRGIRKILSNRKYTGDYIWGEHISGKYYCARNGEIDTPEKGNNTTPIVHRNRHQAVIDRDTFEKVQTKLSDRRHCTSGSKKHTYVLHGLLYCAHCGSSMFGHTGRAYRCSGYHLSGKARCTCNSIQEQPLVDCIAWLIQQRYLSDENLARLRKELDKQLRSRPRRALESAERLRNRIAELDRKIENGAERIFEAPAELTQTLYEKLAQLRRERDRLEEQLKRMDNCQVVDEGKWRAEAEQALEALQNLRQAFATADRADLYELLRSVVSRIELSFTRRQSGKYTRTSFDRGVVYLRPDSKSTNGGTNWRTCSPQCTVR